MATTYCVFGEPISGVQTCTSCGRRVHATGKVSARCRVSSSGPGAELKALLASFGITASPTCQCNKMAAQMDAWGPEESLNCIDQIVDVMQETAQARQLPFLRAIGRKLVRIACARARKKSAQTGQ